MTDRHGEGSRIRVIFVWSKLNSEQYLCLSRSGEELGSAMRVIMWTEAIEDLILVVCHTVMQYTLIIAK